LENQEFDFLQQKEGDELLPVEEMPEAEPAESAEDLETAEPEETEPEYTDEVPVAQEAEAENNADSQRASKKKTPWQKSLLMYVHDLIFLLATIVVVFLLLFRVVVVSGTSMNNTLMDGDYLLLLSNVFYRDPKPGDIIVASKSTFDNGAPIVKRVIATEGQTVDIDFQKGIVYVDGVALDEPYTLTSTTVKEGVKFPLVVDEGCLFVLGDNRDGSKDSRNPEIGLIDKREVLGKVIFLFFPGTNVAKVERDFDRIGVVS